MAQEEQFVHRSGMEPAVRVDGLARRLSGAGFDRIETLSGATFKDCRTVVIVPTRGLVPIRVVHAWQSLIQPMNQARFMISATGDEVGTAYNRLIQTILNSDIRNWPYVLTLEDDNLPPPDAHIRLLETMQMGFDAVSGLYWTKGPFNMPMAYGDPDAHRRTGVLDFEPRDVRPFLSGEKRGNVMEVNGIAMGCALWRMSMFIDLAPPWYYSVSDVMHTPAGPRPMGMTQDLYFCRRARQMGKRFAVDLRVKVGHLDVQTGTVY